MSIFHKAQATCPKCGTKSAVELVASVNADRRPDLRAAILDGTFQAQTCPKCGAAMRLLPYLTFMNLKRGQWILVQPPAALEQWQAEEQEAQALYDESFGAAAPKIAQELAEGLQPRVVFGWPALREKLICSDLSVDDTTLELLKIAIVRDVAQPPLADQTELRLVGGDDDVLHFSWIETATEGGIADLDVPRAAYTGVAGDTAAWVALRGNFEGKMFVDMQRLLVG
jgi:ribosomal protein S27AE